jgi:hypothetical protein
VINVLVESGKGSVPVFGFQQAEGIREKGEKGEGSSSNL